RDALQRAGPKPAEHAGIDRDGPPETVGIAAEITHGGLPRGADLALESGVPRLDARRIDAGIDCGVGPEAGEGHVGRDRIRDRVLLPAGDATIRILEHEIAAEVDAVVER